MGQYYRLAFMKKGSSKVYTNDRAVVDTDRVMAKLTEHSYFGNVLMDSVADMLFNRPHKLIWVGDYAEEDELESVTTADVSYQMVWGDVMKNHTKLLKSDFDYGGKYLVNHDTKQYVSFDDYRSKSKITFKGWEGYEPNPISLLTAIGNGRGGGDYHGTNEKKVGKWAWNTIEITDCKPKGYRKMSLSFKESWIADGESKKTDNP